jgi:hypothetical protein
MMLTTHPLLKWRGQESVELYLYPLLWAFESVMGYLYLSPIGEASLGSVTNLPRIMEGHDIFDLGVVKV